MPQRSWSGMSTALDGARSSSVLRRTCCASRTGSTRAVAEAVDGHPELSVDCLAEPMCQTRAGESGS